MSGDIFDLTGRVAMVTASSRGIGFGIAQAMAARGASVVISSRKAEACEDAARTISDTGGDVLAAPCNVGHKDQLEGMVESAMARWGRIDILVCNAGINPYYGPLAEIGDDMFDKTMATNVRSTLWLCNMVLPGMAERGGGAALLVASIAGLRGTDKMGAYGISKAAEIGMTRHLAVEWGPSNIRINCIAPGVIRTRFARVLYESPEMNEPLIAATPLGRVGEVEDVAGAAVFLCSDASRFVTGQVLVIDGGRMTATG